MGLATGFEGASGGVGTVAGAFDDAGKNEANCFIDDLAWAAISAIGDAADCLLSVRLRPTRYANV
jgi:hypothetical protein